MAKEEKKEEEPKIIVDEDWKAEARKEKEILAAQEKAEKAVEQEKNQKNQARGRVPPGNFAALVSTLATQAVYSMGLMPVEGRENPEPDLEIARFNIDMLATIEEKTKGNLSKNEERVLKNTLSELRMTFVKLTDKTETKDE
ncbi:MAG TPA: DUF1844 domain-containing protein [Sedimentisphaerales bacterium]|nr:DUF1844 domain-containing protein [Sedimentisphaerales bacterium]